MDHPTLSLAAPQAANGPVPARLAALGGGLLVALPLAMWIANRSAPLMLALAAAAFCAAALTAEGWRPPLRSEAGLARFAWMEAAGARGWPVLGAVYMVEAVKRVRGMRLVGLARRERAGQRAAAPAG